MEYVDYYLHSTDKVALMQLSEVFNQAGDAFDYIGQIPATYGEDGAALTFQPGYFANLRLARQLEPGELSAYLITPPLTPFRMWAA
ncbi:MAG: hypothetical protein V4468_03435 [Pseudomonadota bacterium]